MKKKLNMKGIQNEIAAGSAFFERPAPLAAQAEKKRAEKTARNISKNTTIIIPAHNIPSFKPAKSFVSQVKNKVK